VSREPHGFAIVPLGRDGKTTGGAFWERSAEDAMRVYHEMRTVGRALFPIPLYRPIRVEDKGGAHAAEREAPCPPKSSSAT
jgi:hypothetical protein